MDCALENINFTVYYGTTNLLQKYPTLEIGKGSMMFCFVNVILGFTDSLYWSKICIYLSILRLTKSSFSNREWCIFDENIIPMLATVYS